MNDQYEPSSIFGHMGFKMYFYVILPTSNKYNAEDVAVGKKEEE